MIKVFLVEDEIVVREGIKNKVSWEENGFYFCGEASDGELAYPMIQKLRPDIVITDIRMPFMDGLELSRLLRKEAPGIKIIILSGYGEFEYAKEAMHIGITEYLLKPISGAELMKSMKKVRDNILQEREERENLARFRQEMKEYVEDEKRHLFNDLVKGTEPLASLIERGKELNLELGALAYNIVLFSMHLPKQYGADQAAAGLEAELDLLFENQKEVIKFNCFPEGTALLFKGGSMEEVCNNTQHYIKHLKNVMEKNGKLAYFGGIGKPVNRLGELPASYHEANRVFAYRYIWDISDILDYAAIAKENTAVGCTDDTVMHHIIRLDKKKVEAFLKSGSREELNYFVEEYLKSIGTNQWNSLLLRQYIMMDVYRIAAGFLEEVGYTGDVPQISLQKTSFEDTKGYIEALLAKTIELRDDIAAKHYNDMIVKAKEFIQDNYQKEELNLNQVAASVYISPTHLSAVFHQRTGQPFIRYLTDLRLNKAKELLRCTDLRTSDIGYAVGYKDPRYFSYLFKKTMNCTPKQYRCGASHREGCNDK